MLGGVGVTLTSPFNFTIMPKINFSKRTFAKTSKYKIRPDILQQLEGSNAAREEIRRIFQVANRRIQNIESKDLISPALQALGKGNIKGFTKFSMKHSWEDLKTEYSKAIGFLRQPTSTASGTREYNKHLQEAYDLTPDEFDLMAKKLNDKIISLDDSDFVEKYLMRYKDFTGELERTVSDVSTQMENEAVQLQNAIDKEIDRIQVDVTPDEAVDYLTQLFDNFGL